MNVNINIDILFFQTLQDVRFSEMCKKISNVLHEDTHYEKSSLNMRTQRCFAVRSGMNGILVLFAPICCVFALCRYQ